MRKFKPFVLAVFLLIAIALFASTVPTTSAACGSISAATGSVSGATTTAANIWQNTGAEVTVDIGSYTGDIFVISSLQSSSTQNAMTASWRLTDGTLNSVPINRYIASANDYGIGTVTHIFQNLTGSNTFRLQHQTNTNNRNTITTATIVAVPLITDAGNALNHGLAAVSGSYATTTSTYSAVPNTTTSVTLPTTGDVYVATSLNSSSGVGQSTRGEWKLQYRLLPAGTWNDLGWATRRNHSGSNDTGAVSLIAMGKNLAGGSYEFRLAVSAIDGRNINTFNVTLSAIALSYEYGSSQYGYFPAQQSHAATVGISQVNTRETVIVVNQNVSAESGAQLFMSSQYQMGGNSGGTTMTFDVAVDNGSSYQSQDQRRRLANTGDIGSGGSVGLSGLLAAGSNHNIQLRFEADRLPAVLTNPVFVSIGMTCRDDYSPTAVSLLKFSSEQSQLTLWLLPGTALLLSLIVVTLLSGK